MSSGLYEAATERRILIPHEELPASNTPGREVILLPEQLAFVSYPYEWCFSQFKSSAHLLLDLQELALSHGMSLKDATAFNIQFHKGKPVFIDTSSFEAYREGQVWHAYRQFCEHFLCPMLLMARVDDRLALLLKSSIDGIPVDLAAKLLPKKTWLNPWLYMHIGLHGKSQKERKGGAKGDGGMPKNAMLGLLKSLRQAVDALHWSKADTQWGDYSSASSYSEAGARHKHELVAEYRDLLDAPPAMVWDLGANSGEFSRIFADKGILTVAWDGDPSAVEQNYQAILDKGQQNLVPLIQDFSNPSPGLGWMGTERMSFFERGPVDLVLALALIHHIVIGNNVPFAKAAEFFARVGRTLVIEFVAPEDPRVQELLSTRTETHPYSQEEFEGGFARLFEIVRRDPIRDSRRTVYLMKRKAL